MNISGIHPVSGLYSNRNYINEGTSALQPGDNKPTAPSFGAYDVGKLHKPASNGVTNPGRITKIHSRAQVEKAVDTMRKDSSLHKYQKFIGEGASKAVAGRDVMENFTL